MNQSSSNNTFAVIFDMDDLLVSSKSTWKKAEREILSRCNREFSKEIARLYHGRGVDDVAETMYTEYAIEKTSRDKFRDQFRDLLVNTFPDGLQPMPGAVEIVRRLRGSFTLAVASGSPLPAISNAIDTMKVSDCFSVLVSAEEVPAGKPEPDVFLKAADRLRIEPEKCLVIEDSLVGVTAAKKAGMKCFAVPRHQKDKVAEIADRVFDSLEQISRRDTVEVLKDCSG